MSNHLVPCGLGHAEPCWWPTIAIQVFDSECQQKLSDGEGKRGRERNGPRERQQEGHQRVVKAFDGKILSSDVHGLK